MKIAVTGATGRVGRHVVDVLKARGHEVVPISRANGVDLVSGEGLKKALSGVSVVVDAASTPSPDQQTATEFFTKTSKNLQEIGHQAGVRLIVVVSIIGIDRFTTGYLAAKQTHERIMLAGPVPVRILRAAQFHEFVEQLVSWGTKDGVSYLPDWRTQLVAARTVAEALADLAVNGSAFAPVPDSRRITEIAGPREEHLVDAAKRLVARRKEGLRIEGVSDPANPDAPRYEEGALLPGPKATRAGPTFDAWLEPEVA